MVKYTFLSTFCKLWMLAPKDCPFFLSEPLCSARLPADLETTHSFCCHGLIFYSVSNWKYLSTFRLHPGPVSGAVLRELLLEVVEPLLVTRGHGVGEPRAVRVEDLEAVIPSVGETVNPDLALQVLNVTAGDYRDLTVRKLRQSGTQGKLIVCQETSKKITSRAPSSSPGG